MIKDFSYLSSSMLKNYQSISNNDIGVLYLVCLKDSTNFH